MSTNEAFQTFEREVHDRIAGSYHAAFTPVTEQAHAPLLDAGRVRAGSRLLDVAAGPGVLAGKAAGLGAIVTGIDLSPRMVELATGLHANALFIEANAEALPFEEAAFDVILSGFGIGHFADPDQAFADFHRVLAPGGRLAVSWWAPPSQSRINGMFFDALREEAITPTNLPEGPGAFLFSDTPRLHVALAGAGFSDIETRRHVGIHHLPDFESLWSLARGSFARLGTIIDGLSAPDRARYKAAVAAKASAYGSTTLAIPIAFDITSART